MPSKVQARMISSIKAKVEVEAKAVAEAGSINSGSHIHGIVQKEREKVQKEKAKEKVSIQTSIQDMFQKVVQRAQASSVKVAVNLQSLAIRVVKEVTLQTNVTATKVLNLWFNKFSKIRRIINNRCILHLSFQVLVLQQFISPRRDW